ncbi:hypothetical protein SAMN05216251_12738 [Actinacidiphila alni]|uniref:NlpC/P60 domain-containing protein n=1 Tax=Actinacidiphila alni TaxID=380248 RepID=A0A1I2L6W4_9ACTN|nr:hypothetical protein [Actinacidiphila alni]SFF74965.1 hypothetical protein SAMN05216251_12738 [Actinacidiphila alni]
MKTAVGLFGAVVAAGLGLLALCVLVASGTTGRANARTCSTVLQSLPPGSGGAGPPGDPVKLGRRTLPTHGQVTVPLKPIGPQQTARWTREQLRNATTITAVARTRSVPPRGAVIAVATAIQESSLNNLDDGDRDSLGLFQQRPSQGWGTPAQLTDPVYATNAFFDALLKIRNWQTMPLSRAAQAVERSAAPGAYAKWEQAAGALVTTAWGTYAVTSITTGCDDTATADPTAVLTTRTPRSPSQAIAAARAEAGRPGWYRRCDNFVAQAYGYGSSGSATADVHWNRLVGAGLAHPGDGRPPPGALLFYDNHNVGHVALYLGGDLVASNDVLDTFSGEGAIAIVHRRELTNGHWRLRYRGWAEPAFPDAAGTSTLPIPKGIT